MVKDPVVVFEILSPGTSYKDRIEKNREYRATPSIQRYVILGVASGGHSVCTRQQRLGGRLPDADADPGMPEIGIGAGSSIGVPYLIPALGLACFVRGSRL